MTLQDVIQFVSRNEGRWLQNIGGRGRFNARLARGKTIVITIESGKTLNASHDLIEKGLTIFKKTNGSINTSEYRVTGRASYLLRLFSEIKAEHERVHNLPPDPPIEEKEILAAPKTDQAALRMSRMGQGRYREQLLQLRKCCYVTGVSEQVVLRASHIKAWEKSNNRERLDPHNGLLLTPNYDVLFDAGYISFADDGHILLSEDLPPAVIAAFAINPNFKGLDLGKRTRTFLAYHREHRFRG